MVEVTTKDLTGRGRALIHPQIALMTRGLIKEKNELAITPRVLVVSELDSEESQLGLDEKESLDKTSLHLPSSSLLLSSWSNLMNGPTRSRVKVLTALEVLENMVLIIVLGVGGSSI